MVCLAVGPLTLVARGNARQTMWYSPVASSLMLGNRLRRRRRACSRGRAAWLYLLSTFELLGRDDPVADVTIVFGMLTAAVLIGVVVVCRAEDGLPLSKCVHPGQGSGRAWDFVVTDVAAATSSRFNVFDRIFRDARAPSRHDYLFAAFESTTSIHAGCFEERDILGARNGAKQIVCPKSTFEHWDDPIRRRRRSIATVGDMLSQWSAHQSSSSSRRTTASSRTRRGSSTAR